MPPIDTPTPNSDQKQKAASTSKIAALLSSFSILGLFFSAFIFALGLNAFVFQPYEVDGSSMEPTLSTGDRLIVNKLGRTIKKITSGDYIPSRGDIIVFKRNGASTENQLIKRVIGLPGDRVTITNGTITVFNDDNPSGFDPDQDGSLDLSPTSGEGLDVKVSDGEVFVVGDNRIPGASLDSRSSLGNISSDDIIGTLSFRFYPLTEAKGF